MGSSPDPGVASVMPAVSTLAADSTGTALTWPAGPASSPYHLTSGHPVRQPPHQTFASRIVPPEVWLRTVLRWLVRCGVNRTGPAEQGPHESRGVSEDFSSWEAESGRQIRRG